MATHAGTPCGARIGGGWGPVVPPPATFLIPSGKGSWGRRRLARIFASWAEDLLQDHKMARIESDQKVHPQSNDEDYAHWILGRGRWRCWRVTQASGH